MMSSIATLAKLSKSDNPALGGFLRRSIESNRRLFERVASGLALEFLGQRHGLRFGEVAVIPHAIDSGLREPMRLPRGLAADAERIGDSPPRSVLSPSGRHQAFPLRLEALDLLTYLFEADPGLGGMSWLGHGWSTVVDDLADRQPWLTTTGLARGCTR